MKSLYKRWQQWEDIVQNVTFPVQNCLFAFSPFVVYLQEVSPTVNKNMHV